MKLRNLKIKNKRGFGFLLIIFVVMTLAIIVLGSVLFFNQTIKDTIQIIVDFIVKYGKWFFLLTILLIFNQQAIQLVQMVINIVKSILKRMGLG